MSKLTPQDYLSIIELIKDNFETSEDNQVVEYWDVIVESSPRVCFNIV